MILKLIMRKKHFRHLTEVISKGKFCLPLELRVPSLISIVQQRNATGAERAWTTHRLLQTVELYFAYQYQPHDKLVQDDQKLSRLRDNGQ